MSHPLSKSVKKDDAAKLVHFLFPTYEIKETCTWYGTKYQGEGKDTRLLPCGEPAIGAGLFCNPAHIHCEIHSLCERHSRNKQTENLGEL